MKHVAKAFAVAIAALLCARNASAETMTDKHGQVWTYSIDEHTGDAEITGVDYDSLSSCVAVPDELDGHAVKSIGYNVFAYYDDITDVVLPDSVVSIGSNAFYYCKSLKSVNMPANLLSIGESAFQLTALAGDIIIPNGVTNIAAQAFYNCESIESVSIPGAVQNIGGNAFSFDYQLRAINVREINDAVNYFRSLDGVVYSYDGKRLVICPGGKAYITIPASVGSIDDKCFQQNDRLEYIQVDYGNATFSSDNGVLYSRDKTNLILCPAQKTQVTIHSSVTNIWNFAFYHSKIQNLTIPSNVSVIGDAAFSACFYLENIFVDAKNKCFKSNEGVLYTKDGTVLVAAPDQRAKIAVAASATDIGRFAFFSNGNLTTVVLQPSVRNILFEAFGFCLKLKEFIIPYGVRSIEPVACWTCPALQTVEIPASVDSVGWQAFADCSSLSNLKISRGVQMIGDYAFANDISLETVTIPASVGKIGLSAFYGCSNLWYVRAPRTLQEDIEKNQVFAACDEYLYIDYFDASDCLVQCFSHPEQQEAGGTVSMSTKTELVAPGTEITLTAKTSNSKTAFAYWADRDGNIAGYTATLKVHPVRDTNYRAVFRLKTECQAPEFDIEMLQDAIAQASANAATGSEFNAQITVNNAAYPVKFTASNLPAGLKIDAASGLIYGKATKPGVYKVTVSATNATVKKPVTAEFEIAVPNLASEKLPGLEQDNDAYGVVMCGVALPTDLVDCAPEDGWTVKVAGLPAGLKFTAKDIVDSKTKKVTVPANTIYGVPTKAGTYTVTFTATKGKEKQVATITLNVEELPLWAQGTFTGYVAGTRDACPCRGFASMTIAANGKISGKIALDGTNWTFSAASFSCVEYVERVEGGVATNFVVEAVAKAGKVEREVVLAVSGHAGRVTLPGGGFIETALPNAVAEGTFGEGEVKMWRGMWKDKATAAEATAAIEKFIGVYTVSIANGADYGSGYLSLAVGKDGNVKATGKLADGTSMSATSTLMYDEDAGWLVMLYAAPSAYKGGAFAAAVGFDADGAAAAGRPPYRLTPVLFAPRWSSGNVQATGEYGEGFEREVDLAGAYYDKLDTLRKYYESVRVGLDGALGDRALPELGYTFKESYVNELGKKVTVSSASAASAVDTFRQSGLTAAVNDSGAIVVEKTTKPVQDRQTKDWSYDGANDGALTLSFTQATGIFKGSYTFWYDYVSAYDDTTGKSTKAHTSKKVSFEGILVQGEEPKMDGFYLWDATGEYEDAKTGKTKTYKYKQSFPVSLRP